MTCAVSAGSIHKDGDTEYSALTEFFAFSRGLPVYAYNAKFDRDFIRETAKRSGYHDENFRFDVEDIMNFVDMVFDDLPNRKLETVAKRLGYPTKNIHRALEDCSLGLAVLIHCKQKLMIQQTTLAREEYLQLKRKTEELKVSQNSIPRDNEDSQSFFKVLGIAVFVVFVLALALRR